ncbi:MAG: hypothetical protein GF308_11665 [Candidatus Heimdallarchaeota archaeon]|nr:hypothetical protein [Candidatus Heimdallarchaeota archaeon]
MMDSTIIEKEYGFSLSRYTKHELKTEEERNFLLWAIKEIIDNIGIPLGSLLIGEQAEEHFRELAALQTFNEIENLYVGGRNVFGILVGEFHQLICYLRLGSFCSGDFAILGFYENDWRNLKAIVDFFENKWPTIYSSIKQKILPILKFKIYDHKDQYTFSEIVEDGFSRYTLVPIPSSKFLLKFFHIEEEHLYDFNEEFVRGSEFQESFTELVAELDNLREEELAQARKELSKEEED